MSSSRPYVLLCLSAVLYLFQIFMIPRVTFNWDELQELATLFSHDSGYAVQSVRKGLHYFIWPLKYTGLQEDVLMTLVRYLAFFTVVSGTYLMVYLIGRRLRSHRFGLVAVLLLLSFGSYYETVIQYRTDTYITFAFITSFYLLFRGMRDERLPWLAPACLMGAAMFINPKAAYHVLTLAVFFGYMFLAGSRRAATFWRAFGFGMGTLALFLILTQCHILFYDIGGGEAAGQAGDSVKTGMARVHGVAYKLTFLRQAFLFAFVPCICLAFGLWHGLKRFLPWWRRPAKWAPVWLASVCLLATLIIHQGTYKYYIIDILPPAALLAARPVYGLMLRLERARRLKQTPWSPLIQLASIVAGIAVVFLFRLPLNAADQTRYQRQTIAGLNRVFPIGAPYADGVGLMARGNNVMGLFTAKQFKMYQQRGGEKVLYRKFRHTFPGYVLPSVRFPVFAFPKEDQELLRQWFVPFYDGRLWVHGRTFTAGELAAGLSLELKVSGPYVLSGAFEGLTIDGEPAQSGAVLSAGTRRLACDSCGDFSLTYGLRLPTEVIPEVIIKPRRQTITLAEGADLYTSPWEPPPGNGLTFNGQETLQPFGNYSVIRLSGGSHTVLNRTGRTITLSPLGPLYERYER
ncbi:MAG: glycosyltransferase family 39 protein [Acidobacteriota bacterium]|nr:glycosyltransferase family 39 protein [Acidobacteriota bacterium]